MGRSGGGESICSKQVENLKLDNGAYKLLFDITTLELRTNQPFSCSATDGCQRDLQQDLSPSPGRYMGIITERVDMPSPLYEKKMYVY